jgi:hypothetical protein
MLGNGLTLAYDVEFIAIFIYLLFLLLLIVISEHIEGSTDVSFQTQFLQFVQIFSNKRYQKSISSTP